MKITSNRRAAVAIKVLVLVGIAFMVNLWAVNSLRSDNANNAISEVGPESKTSFLSATTVIVAGKGIKAACLGGSPAGNMRIDHGIWSIGKNGTAAALFTEKSVNDQLSSSVTTHFPLIKKHAYDTAVDGFVGGVALSNGNGMKKLITVSAGFLGYPAVFGASQESNGSILFNADMSSEKPMRKMSDMTVVGSTIATNFLLQTPCVQDGLVSPAVRIFEEVALQDKNCSPEEHKQLVALANFILLIGCGELVGHGATWLIDSALTQTAVSGLVFNFGTRFLSF